MIAVIEYSVKFYHINFEKLTQFFNWSYSQLINFDYFKSRKKVNGLQYFRYKFASR